MEFLAWCDKHGVKYDSVDYPVAFGKEGKLVGCAAKRDIGLNEAYVYVPVGICINEEQFKRSWCGEIYSDKYDEIKENIQFHHQFLLIFFIAQ